MHNFKGYDSHLIIEQAYKINESLTKKLSDLPQSDKDLLNKPLDKRTESDLEKIDVIEDSLVHKSISAIPLSSEKFMSVTVGDLRFIDSMQFMASSLQKLVENLYDDKDNYKNFTHMKKYYNEHGFIMSKRLLSL